MVLVVLSLIKKEGWSYNILMVHIQIWLFFKKHLHCDFNWRLEGSEIICRDPSQEPWIIHFYWSGLWVLWLATAKYWAELLSHQKHHTLHWFGSLISFPCPTTTQASLMNETTSVTQLNQITFVMRINQIYNKQAIVHKVDWTWFDMHKSVC